MTALVSVMNKHAVAIAADSALTITNRYGHKVINSANKVFALSKIYPIGVMFCGDASFMDTPWEVIIKQYRHTRRDHAPFNTVEDYKKDFLCFLKEEHFFCSPNAQKKRISIEAHSFYDLLCKVIKQKGISDANFSVAMEAELMDVLNDKYKTCDGIADTFVGNNFKLYSSEAVASVILKHKDFFDGKQDRMQLFHDSFVNFIRKQNSNITYTGIVFVGYGEKEIFPSLSSLRIYFVYDNDKLRYYEDMAQCISEDCDASISRFAQIDVINTIINGINPSLYDIVLNTFSAYTEELKKKIVNAISSVNDKQAIGKLDLRILNDAYKNTLDTEIKNRFTDPLIYSIGNLDKEDMAELVESLISVTHLNMRITSSEEIVGGPVDVAIISKGDGFIWKKRKHYFDSSLNKHFFMNYLKV